MAPLLQQRSLPALSLEAQVSDGARHSTRTPSSRSRSLVSSRRDATPCETQQRLEPKGKLSQAELLMRLSPVPFDMRNVVPANAKTMTPPEGRWWRSDSPGREKDRPRDALDISMSQTRGVLGFGLRRGPGCFQTSYAAGSGSAAHFQDVQYPKSISGYSGHIAGKLAGNVVGGTYNKSLEDSIAHLETTAQARKFGRLATTSAAW
eukprot:TRINITY_DN57870_c0_g1_i1.p1 TRINITY_DN57870_c0_g1~~TRINITY_DN57870_c0_g1_i1.p1  ORF type:complete len:206 (-),score=14.96 TRINITY_DN57870_c0_g1_i1:323-940(-)